MIIFIYGTDTYQSQAKFKGLVEQYQKNNPKGLSLRYFDLLETRFQDILDGLAVFSMFKEKKFFVLINVFASQGGKESVASAGQALLKSEDIILIYEKGAVLAKDTLLKFLKSKAECFDFPLLEGLALKKWLQKQAKQYGLEIEPEAVSALIQATGSDLWQASQEIQKLSAHILSQGEKRITQSAVELLTKSKIETDIFKTIDALAERDKGRALRLLHRHLEKGDAPLYLLTMFNYQARNLLVVKDLMEKGQPYSAILSKTKLHPFVVRKTCSQAQKFTLEKIKKIYRKIFQADVAIKSGKIDPYLALDLLVAEI